MRGNSIGNIFTITTFGESHGEALGVIIDGVPAGIKVDAKGLQDELDRRRPGRLKVSTSRNEADQFEVLSGIFDEKTIGTPITVIVRNTNQRSHDYTELKDNYRPGHADQTTMDKFGHRDHRGGGRSSGRETLARVIGGYFAGLILPSEIKFSSKITKISGLDPNANAKETEDYLLNLKKTGESAGGIVEFRIENCPRGLGEPVFDKLKADLSKAMISIGSCMGITFGLGAEFANLLGSEISNDQSNFGGIEGGISNGETIYAQLYFKAPSTIGEKATAGRHDPCILPRVLPVVESMAKVIICDHYLRQNAFQLK
jgi:chorismate synthase